MVKEYAIMTVVILSNCTEKEEKKEMAVSKKTANHTVLHTKKQNNQKKTSQTTSRTASRAKTSQTKKKAASHKQTVKENSSFPLKREITVIVTFAVSVLILISCFSNESSSIWWLHKLIFSIFGNVGYIVSPLLFLTVCFVLSNQGDRRLRQKLFGGFLCLIALLGIFQLIFSTEVKNGGGIFGKLIIGIFQPWLGQIGSYVIMASMAAIGTVIITERSLMHLLGQSSKQAYSTVKSGMNKQKEKLTQKKQTRGQEEKNGSAAYSKSALPFDSVLQPKISINDIPIRGITDVSLGAEEPDVQPILKDNVQKEITIDIPWNARRHQSADLEETGPDFPLRRQTAKDPKIEEEQRKKPRTIRKKPSFSVEGTDPNAQMRTLKTASGKVITVDLNSVPTTQQGNTMQSSLENNKKLSEQQKQLSNQKTVQKEKKSADSIQKTESVLPKEYTFPPLSLLRTIKGSMAQKNKEQELRNTAMKLQQTLQNFGVGVTVTNISCGPAVTRYELHPEQGVKVSKIVSLTDDIKLNLAAADIRMEAPIPGKAAIGIEVPNKENQTVMLRELLESQEFLAHPSKVAFAVGKNIAGNPIIADIAQMPHLLIAGATGSGKSVCINTLIMSILYKAKPSEVKLIMIDPKVVELSVYNGIPHLMIPVVTEPKKAAGALNWAVAEMTERYHKFAEYNVRDRRGYNQVIERMPEIEGIEKPKKLPQIVIIVDELADLMMVAPAEVEDAICRLAQMARAAGIHLVIATQRPSVNVVTGLIKANVPSRIAFAVSSGVDSRTIIDMNGAEKLLGRGDMLFYPSGYQKPERVQGAFVSDAEVSKVVSFLSEQINVDGREQNEQLDMTVNQTAESITNAAERDEYFEAAGRFLIEKEKASIGMLQRMFKIGFNRAARIVQQLEDAGVVGQDEGTKPRKILMTMQEFEEMIHKI